MLFNSLDYLIFLCATLCVYWSLRQRFGLRIGFMLLVSSAFYMAWNPAYIFLILISSCSDWLVASKIFHAPDQAIKKRWLWVSVVVNLGLLGIFKYFDFASSSSSALLSHFAGHSVQLPMLHWMLPVGISFYTFESMSYCIDVYRGHTAPAKNPFHLLFFIVFFPKLVAGPIARPKDLLPQLEAKPSLSRAHFGTAIFLIGTGLIKKIVFSDYISVNLVDRVFDTPEGYTASEALVALWGFTLQIYADFSGYTDIARGSARLFGIELPENFDRPYQAQSPADFWRRWHMTLSTWLRDYLYFPLGGSKHGEARTYFNLWLTIFLIGLWHGASWNFVIYGSIQATSVAIHRFVSKKHPAQKNPSWALVALKIALNMQIVVFSRVLFRASDLENAKAVVSRLFSNTYSMANVGLGVGSLLLLGLAMHYLPRSFYTKPRDAFAAFPGWAQALCFVILVCGLRLIATAEARPYIYFQF